MSNYFLSKIDVDPSQIPKSSEEEKKDLLNILMQAEVDGELNLSQFSNTMGAFTNIVQGA
jgi:hypothetical protein